MDIKQIITLKKDGVSNRQVHKLLGIHRNTVNEYVKKFEVSSYSMDELLTFNDQKLRELFTTKTTMDKGRHSGLMSYFDNNDLRLKHPGFNAQFHYFDYCNKVELPYGYTQFMEHFNRRYKTPKGSMKLNHVPGDKVYIDFAGKKLHITDRNTGEMIPVEVFVAILPSSQYTFVCACRSQKKEDLITCMKKAFQFYSGAPKAIVPDNLKSAVSKSSKYEPEINRSFKDLARHYDCVVSPTRSYSPQDKALVENAVQLAYQRIYYPLRQITFFSLQALNQEISKLLMAYNDTILQRAGASRRQLFESTEKATLKPLPVAEFEMIEYRSAKVQQVGYVYLSPDKNYYSVPYRYIGKQVQLQYTQSSVCVYFNSERIATHRRSYQKGHYTTDTDHLASTHQAYLKWSPEYFKKRTSSIGEQTSKYVMRMIDHFEYPEIAYKRSLGILNLVKKYSSDRLEKACSLGMQAEAYSYRHIANILENKMDLQQESNEPIAEIPPHENIRGASAYQ
ncbi:IS21 family transposase [Persicobacter psychrovividus]